MTLALFVVLPSRNDTGNAMPGSFGHRSSQHSATAAPAVHSIAGECRQEEFVAIISPLQVCFGAPKHNCVAQAEAVHALCWVGHCYASLLCIPLVSWLVWQRHNFAWTATLLLSPDWGVRQCHQNGFGHHPKAGGGERLLTSCRCC